MRGELRPGGNPNWQGVARGVARKAGEEVGPDRLEKKQNADRIQKQRFNWQKKKA